MRSLAPRGRRRGRDRHRPCPCRACPRREQAAQEGGLAEPAWPGETRRLTGVCEAEHQLELPLAVDDLVGRQRPVVDKRVRRPLAHGLSLATIDRVVNQIWTTRSSVSGTARPRAAPGRRSSVSSVTASDRRAQPRAALAEALARRDGDAVLARGARSAVSAVRAAGTRRRTCPRERASSPSSAATRPVAPALVRRAPLLDRLLRAGQRGDAGLLHRPEDAGEDVVLDHLDPAHELRVAEREAEPPAGHAVALRHARTARCRPRARPPRRGSWPAAARRRRGRRTRSRAAPRRRCGSAHSTASSKTPSGAAAAVGFDG